jgi:hypothetical protein
VLAGIAWFEIVPQISKRKIMGIRLMRESLHLGKGRVRRHGEYVYEEYRQKGERGCLRGLGGGNSAIM